MHLTLLDLFDQWRYWCSGSCYCNSILNWCPKTTNYYQLVSVVWQWKGKYPSTIQRTNCYNHLILVQPLNWTFGDLIFFSCNTVLRKGWYNNLTELHGNLFVSHLLLASVIGWRVEPSIHRANFCNSDRSRAWSSTPSPSTGFYSFHVIFGEQVHAGPKLLVLLALIIDE
jgi:hypothetical protein